MRNLLLSLFFILVVSEPAQAQLRAQWIDTTTHKERTLGFFFTNRPLKHTKDGSISFRNRWTRQTGNLYFSLFNFETDSILLKYQVSKTCDKKVYPTEAVEDNIFYGIYENLRIKKGIKSFVFLFVFILLFQQFCHCHHGHGDRCLDAFLWIGCDFSPLDDSNAEGHHRCILSCIFHFR